MKYIFSQLSLGIIGDRAELRYSLSFTPGEYSVDMRPLHDTPGLKLSVMLNTTLCNVDVDG